MALMCKGCGKMPVYKGYMCKGCHAMPVGDLMKVKKGESSSSESGSETTSEHGEQEVRMSLQQLHSVCEAATSLKAHVKKETLVPAWVQSLLTVAHENLEHIEGYFEGKHMKKSVQPPVGAMTPANPRMPAGGVRKITNKPVKPGKQGHAGEALIHRSEDAVEKANVRPKMPAGKCDSCGRTTTQPGKGLQSRGDNLVGNPKLCARCTPAKRPKSQGAYGTKYEAYRDAQYAKQFEKSEEVEKSLVPTFPRVTGDSRVLLQHITPDQTVINQITGRDNHQPHSYGLAPSNWEDGNGLRRR